MKKTFTAILAALLAGASVFTFCACSGEAGDTSETTAQAPASASIPLDLSAAVVVRSDFASDAIVDASMNLRDKLNDALSGGVKLTNDVDLMYGADSAAVVRVIVGETELCPADSVTPYSKTALESLGEDDHVVMCFADGTVVLAGKTDSATKRAVSDFIGGYTGGTIALSAGAQSYLTFAYESAGDDYSDFTPVIRFIVASDVHIKEYESAERERLALMFKYAYEYADSQEYNTIDAAVFAGDVTDHGYASELTYFRGIVEANIREETQFICEMGNHEFFGGSQAVFEQTMGQDADQHNVVNGFHFITVCPKDGSDYRPKYDWLTEALDEAQADNPEAPIFVFQHHHIKDTVYVSEEWYTTQLDDVFRNYPSIIDFSGHSHGPINNPRSIYQDKYTTLGTGTLSYFEMNSGMTYGTIPPDASEAAQFYILEVDADNRVRIMPFNILTGEFFTLQTEDKPDEQMIWYVPVPSDPTTFTYTRERWSTSAAPYFDDDAAITASDSVANGTRINFTFPQAHDDACVYSYTLTIKSDTFTKDYSVFSDYYIEPMPDTVTISAAGIRAGQTYTVTVTAYDCYGVPCSNPLTVEFTAE